MQYRSVFEIRILNPFSDKENMIIVTKCNLQAKLRFEERFRQGVSDVFTFLVVAVGNLVSGQLFDRWPPWKGSREDLGNEC